MNRILFLLGLKPILYGLIGMIISGISFPVAGVIILHNGLIPMRYMLMHGVILGGILSISMKVPLLAAVIPLNIILVIFMMWMSRRGLNLSSISPAMMVCTMGLASLFGHIFDIPAKDTLELLWGSPFALTVSDLVILGLSGIMIMVYISIFFRQISMVFFDADIASSIGVNVKVHNLTMVLFTALFISVAMKLIGAMLIDALVVLPVIVVSKNASSLKKLFVRSSLTGLCLSVVGYFISLWLNLPVSGVIAVLAALIFAVNSVFEVIRRKIK